MMEQDAREEQAIKESKTSKNTTQSNLKRIENEPLAFGKRKFFQRLGVLLSFFCSFCIYCKTSALLAFNLDIKVL